MKTFPILLVIALACLANLTNAWSAPKGPIAVELKGGETPDQIQEAYTKAINGLLPDLADGKSLRSFEATLHNAARPGAEPERLACCKAIASALASDAKPDAKAWLLKLLPFAGRAEVVPALTNILYGTDLELRELARSALEHNPTKEAGEALRKALLKAWRSGQDYPWQAALTLSLGVRKEAESMEGIPSMLGVKDEAVKEAALAALGFISGANPIKPRAGVWKMMPEKLRSPAAESYLKSAELMLKQGKTKEAADMYREVYEDNELSTPIRMAGLVGLLKSTGDEAATKILGILAGDDKNARAIATGVIPDLDSGALKVLASGLGKLPPDSQILVLGTLAERGEKSAMPVALEFAKSKDEKMQLAGLTALGPLGDASTVPVLVETMQGGGNAAGVAKNSLTKLTSEGVEGAIVSSLQSQTDPVRRAALIEVIESRGTASAVPLLIEDVLKDSATVRRPAMHALGKMAQPKDVPAMIKGLLKTSPGSEREEAEKAVANVCARTSASGNQAETVLALYKDGNQSDRTAILPVLGRLGGPKVFEVVKAALASTDAATYQAAVDAISNWPDSDETVETELLTLAQKAEKNSDRAAALRAYIRVIATPSGLPDKARLAKFQKAMELAEGNQEKSLVLERVVEIKRIETLRFVLPYIDQPALAPKACTATLDLARDRGLRGQNKAEFQDALNKVIATSKDQGLLERAKRYSQEKL